MVLEGSVTPCSSEPGPARQSKNAIGATAIPIRAQRWSAAATRGEVRRSDTAAATPGAARASAPANAIPSAFIESVSPCANGRGS